MADLALHTTRVHQLLRRVRQPFAQFRQKWALKKYAALVDRLLAQLIKSRQAEFGGATPHIAFAMRTRSDVAIFLLSDAFGYAPTKVLKLPLTPDAERSTALHRHMVETLHSRAELQGFCTLVPRALAWGIFEGQAYYLETALDGVAASDLIRKRLEPSTLKQAATHAILQLHRGTLDPQLVDERVFAALVGNDLALLYRAADRWPEATLLHTKLKALEALLRCQMYGRELPFAWSHGDYWPGNILVRPADGQLTGIVDWDRALPQQLPLLDVLHLFAFSRKMQQRSELGEQIVTYLLPAQFDIVERKLIDQALDQMKLPHDPAFLQAASLLYWVRFAAANISRYPALAQDQRWLNKNIFIVLKWGIA